MRSVLLIVNVLRLNVVVNGHGSRASHCHAQVLACPSGLCVETCQRITHVHAEERRVLLTPAIQLGEGRAE
jgi:hypothetical protein